MTLQQVRQIEPDATRVENYKDLVIYWTGPEIHTMKQNGDDVHVSDSTLRNALRAIPGGKKMKNNLAVWSDPETGGTQYDMGALESAALKSGMDSSQRVKFLAWVFEGVTDNLTAKQALAAYKDEQETLANA